MLAAAQEIRPRRTLLFSIKPSRTPWGGGGACTQAFDAGARRSTLLRYGCQRCSSGEAAEVGRGIAYRNGAAASAGRAEVGICEARLLRRVAAGAFAQRRSGRVRDALGSG